MDSTGTPFCVQCAFIYDLSTLRFEETLELKEAGNRSSIYISRDSIAEVSYAIRIAFADVLL